MPTIYSLCWQLHKKLYWVISCGLCHHSHYNWSWTQVANDIGPCQHSISITCRAVYNIMPSTISSMYNYCTVYYIPYITYSYLTRWLNMSRVTILYFCKFQSLYHKLSFWAMRMLCPTGWINLAYFRIHCYFKEYGIPEGCKIWPAL